MLDKTDDISVAADNWLALFEDALAKSDAKSDDGPLRTLFHPDSYWRDVLASELEHPDPQRRGRDPERIEDSRPPRRAERLCDRPRPPRAAQGDARGHRRDRSYFQV